MKRIILHSLLLTAFLTLAINAATITSVASGNWNDSATWNNGVPGSGDDVVIDTNTTVTINIPDAACNNLTVRGNLYFDNTITGLGIIVNGSIVVESSGKFNAAKSNPASGQYYQSVELKGDLTVNSGGAFVMRKSSGSLLATARVLFSGNTDSHISLTKTTYSSSAEQFNSVEINKTGGAKVILQSGNLFQNNNTSNGADTLVLTSGIIETGSNMWVTLRTSGGAIYGASESSYIDGTIGHAISNSGSITNDDFPVGDSADYRPINIRFNAPSNATGHFVFVTLHKGNANTGSSSFSGGIDKVSELRYYEIGYNSGSGGAAAMGIFGFSPTYKTDDGVSAGNTDLRVAYSTDNQTTWINDGPTGVTTNPPDTLVSDSLTTDISLASGSTMFVALARLTGTTTNSLGLPTGIEKSSKVQPAGYSLSQNYPNPFNPTTKINFSIAQSGNVKLIIYNVLGEKINELINGYMNTGEYNIDFDASKLSSGVYLYTISSGNFMKTKKMILMK